MPRSPRPNVPGSIHHVVLRGNNRQDIFTSSKGRHSFLSHLGDAVDRLGCRVHAFCLMSNHIHLAIQQGDVPLSKVVQYLAQRHCVETNRARGATGHLFQGRFSSFPVETDAHALELVRYIHLNPVRAGIAAAPEEWPWSSHQAYLGLASFPFLTTEWVLAILGEPVGSRDRFREFVLAGLEEDEAGGPGQPRPAAPSPRAAPPSTPPEPPAADFVRAAIREREEEAPRAVPLDRIVAIVLRETGLAEADLASSLRARRPSRARAAIGWLALHAPSVTLTEVAGRFHRDVSTLSESVAKLDAQMHRDLTLRAWLEELLDIVRRPSPPQVPPSPRLPSSPSPA